MPTVKNGIKNITISGRIASGTTTLARNLSKSLGWELLEGGELFRKFHEEHLDDKTELAVSKRPDSFDLEYEEKIKGILKNETNRIVQKRHATPGYEFISQFVTTTLRRVSNRALLW